MQSGIRIIKRGAGGNTNGLSANESEKTVQQRDREMANTVKAGSLNGKRATAP